MSSHFPLERIFFKLGIYLHLHSSFMYVTTELKMPKACIIEMFGLDALALCTRDAEPAVEVQYRVHASGVTLVISSL